MATSNFGTPRYGLPLVAFDDIYDEEEFDEVGSDILWEDIRAEVEALNKETEHLELELKSGYYSGGWFDVRDTKDYWDYDELDELTDEDAEYFWGETADEVRAEYERDMKLIREKLKEFVEQGAFELGVVARFSNGETIYKQVATSEL